MTPVNKDLTFFHYLETRMIRFLGSKARVATMSRLWIAQMERDERKQTAEAICLACCGKMPIYVVQMAKGLS